MRYLARIVAIKYVPDVSDHLEKCWIGMRESFGSRSDDCFRGIVNHWRRKMVFGRRLVTLQIGDTIFANALLVPKFASNLVSASSGGGVEVDSRDCGGS